MSASLRGLHFDSLYAGKQGVDLGIDIVTLIVLSVTCRIVGFVAHIFTTSTYLRVGS